MSKSYEAAFEILRRLPRISFTNLQHNPGAKKNKTRGRGDRGGKTHGAGQKGSGQRQNFMRTGYETGNSPFHLRFGCQNFYKDHHLKLSYSPLTLVGLQTLIDTGRLRSDLPIDISALSGTGLFIIKPAEKEGGIILQDEGLDNFVTPINLEVQWATEPIIAAIERCGGVITTAYYDVCSLEAAVKPLEFFKRGKPIPRRMLPPQRLIEYYTNPKNRGYLADPDEVAEDRLVLSQKYGYPLPDLNKSPNYNMLIQRKDPRQLFYGLQPGWIVNLVDKIILKPSDPELKEFYMS